jgi:hypothetical protein
MLSGRSAGGISPCVQFRDFSAQSGRLRCVICYGISGTESANWNRSSETADLLKQALYKDAAVGTSSSSLSLNS